MSAKREDAESSAWDRAANDAFEHGDIRALTKLLLEAKMLHDVPIAAVIAERARKAAEREAIEAAEAARAATRLAKAVRS